MPGGDQGGSSSAAGLSTRTGPASVQPASGQGQGWKAPSTKVIKWTDADLLKSDGSNYNMWEENLALQFKIRRWWDLVVAHLDVVISDPQITPGQVEVIREADLCAVASLKAALSVELQARIPLGAGKTAYQYHKDIRAEVKPLSASLIQQTNTDLMNWTLKEHQNLEEGIIDFKKIHADALIAGVPVDPGVAKNVFLGGLGHAYRIFAMNRADHENLQDIYAKLMDQHRRDMRQSKETAAMAHGGPPKRNEGGGYKGNHGQRKKVLRCFNCNFEGHYRRDCPEKQNGGCAKCGHMMDQCPQPPKPGNGPGGNFSRDRGSAGRGGGPANRGGRGGHGGRGAPNRAIFIARALELAEKEYEQQYGRATAFLSQEYEGGGASLEAGEGMQGWDYPDNISTRSGSTARMDDGTGSSKSNQYDLGNSVELHNTHAIEYVCSAGVSAAKWFDGYFICDSGATTHIKNNSLGLHNIRELRKAIHVADGKIIESTHIGDLDINSELTLRDVLVVPQIASNLISVPQFTKCGLEVVFTEKRVEILRDGEVILEGENQKNTYLVPFEDPDVSDRVFWTSVHDDLLHSRLGHPGGTRNDQIISIMRGLGIEVINKRDSKCKCDVCMQGKAHRLPVPHEARDRENFQPGEKYHIDASGKMPQPSIEGNHYYLTITDEGTRFSVTTFHKYKHDFPNQIKEHITAGETLHGRRCKEVQLDGAGEFVGQSLDEWLKAKGIRQKLSAPYQQWQNGIAERLNRTLFNTARCLLLEKGMPNCFWERAIDTASYLRNISPTSCLPPDITPHLLWFGKHGDYNRLKVFGSICWVTRDQQGKKWDARGLKGVFVGYASKYDAYNVYLLDRGVISPCVHVVFDEHMDTRHVWEVGNGRQKGLAPINQPYARPEGAIPHKAPLGTPHVESGSDLKPPANEPNVPNSDTVSTPLSPPRRSDVTPTKVKVHIDSLPIPGVSTFTRKEPISPHPDETTVGASPMPTKKVSGLTRNTTVESVRKSLNVKPDEREKNKNETPKKVEKREKREPLPRKEGVRSSGRLRGITPKYGPVDEKRGQAAKFETYTESGSQTSEAQTKLDEVEASLNSDTTPELVMDFAEAIAAFVVRVKDTPKRSTSPQHSYFITCPHPAGKENEWALIALPGEPQSVKEAIESPQWKEWWKAIVSEYTSLINRKVWDVIHVDELPDGANLIGSKWVFKIKRNDDDTLRYKARLVAQGYTQREGVDYIDMFAPVINLTSVRVLLSIATAWKMLVKSLDVSTAFLYGILEEEAYMKQPELFRDKFPDGVCRLKKSLYGLKQSPRCWNQRFGKFLKESGFVQSNKDACIYHKRTNDDILILGFWVDDVIMISFKESTIAQFITDIKRVFEITESDDPKVFVGLQIDQRLGMLFLHQTRYTTDLLNKFKMTECASVKTPMVVGCDLSESACSVSKSVDPTLYRNIVGSLLYLAQSTRPDISQAVGVLATGQQKPTEMHLTAAKRVLRYLKGTLDFGLVFTGDLESDVQQFANADFADCKETRRSVSGNVTFLYGGLISWLSKKQPSVSLSTMEAELYSLSLAMTEGRWLTQLLREISAKLIKDGAIKVYEDNQSCIHYVNDPGQRGRAKHIDIRLMFMREFIKDGVYSIEYCPTQHMIADILTKPLAADRFEYIRGGMGMLSKKDWKRL